MHQATQTDSATAATDQDTITDAANLAERILARRPLFNGATDAEADRLADAEEADLCALATTPGAYVEKATALLATNLLRYITPSFGEWRVLESLLKGLAEPAQKHMTATEADAVLIALAAQYRDADSAATLTAQITGQPDPELEMRRSAVLVDIAFCSAEGVAGAAIQLEALDRVREWGGAWAEALRGRLLDSIARAVCRAAGHPVGAALDYDYRPVGVF
jgi:hypothetical protein